jgi:hypothetical protein
MKTSRKDRLLPAQEARERAGYGGREGLERAAKKLKYTARYIRKVEQNGGGSDLYCPRAARLFRCPGDLFFFAPEYFSAKKENEPMSMKKDIRR